MGIGRMLTMGAEHVIKQAQVDAARIKQKASNEAKLSLVESQKIIQSANNAASDVYADSARKVQAANNGAATAVAAGRQSLQDASNAGNKKVADAQRDLQATFNGQAILVAAAKKTVQDSRNARSASDSSLALLSQSLKNKRILDAAGERASQVLSETMQGMDRAVNQGVFGRIQAAQMLGASTAQAAALGVGGSSVDQIKDTIQMQQAFQAQADSDELHSKVVNAYRQRGNVMADAVGSLDFSAHVAEMDRDAIAVEHDSTAITDHQDFSPVFAQLDYSAIVAQKDYTAFSADLDYTRYLDHKKMGAFQTIATVGLAAAATYFGGPKAGEAVIDGSMAINDAQNLDFQAANAGFSSALSNGASAFQTYRSTQAPKPKTNTYNQTYDEAVNLNVGSNPYSTVSAPNYGANFKF